jgi:hypothetical protein
VLDFGTPAPNRGATEPGDVAQSLPSATPPLKGEQANKTPPIFFIQTCQHTIDRQMLFGHGAIRMLLTGLANTLMNFGLVMSSHSDSSCGDPDQLYGSCQGTRNELITQCPSYF